RNLIGYLRNYKNINTILFMGGNSKNGPEYFFRKQLKEHQLKLEVVDNEVPRIHQFELPTDSGPMSVRALPITIGTRTIKTVSLTAPSGAANRAVGSLQAYKDLKSKDPKFN